MVADDVVEDRRVVGERLARLIEVGDARILSDDDGATGRMHIAQDRSQERRLARPVAAHDADALALGQDPGEALDEAPPAELERHVRYIEDGLAAACVLHLERERASLLRLGRGAHALDALNPGALLGAARLRLAAQPFEL